jgi:WD40 repeat protein
LLFEQKFETNSSNAFIKWNKNPTGGNELFVFLNDNYGYGVEGDGSEEGVHLIGEDRGRFESTTLFQDIESALQIEDEWQAVEFFDIDNGVVISVGGKQLYIYNLQTQEISEIFAVDEYLGEFYKFSPHMAYIWLDLNLGNVQHLPYEKLLQNDFFDGNAAVKILGATTDTKIAQQAAMLGLREIGICYSPDEKLFVTAARNKNAILWDLETGEPIQTLGDRSHDSCTFSEDGRYLAFFNDDKGIQNWSVKIVDVENGSLLGSVDYVSTDSILAFMPDSSAFVLMRSPSTVKIYDLAAVEDNTFQVEEGAYMPFSDDQAQSSKADSAQISPDGQFIATLSIPEGYSEEPLYTFVRIFGIE